MRLGQSKATLRPSRVDPASAAHELRPDRIVNGLVEDAVDLGEGLVVERPPHDVGDRFDLLGPERVPECDLDAAIEDPAGGQVDGPLAGVIMRKAVEPLVGLEVLLVA